MTATERDPILNEEKLAEMLNKPRRTVRRWVKAGLLPGRPLPDGSVVVEVEELREWATAVVSEAESES